MKKMKKVLSMALVVLMLLAVLINFAAAFVQKFFAKRRSI